MTDPRVAGQCKGSWEKERGDGKISGGEEMKQTSRGETTGPSLSEEEGKRIIG